MKASSQSHKRGSVEEYKYNMYSRLKNDEYVICSSLEESPSKEGCPGALTTDSWCQSCNVIL
jgi:hypothetical protein